MAQRTRASLASTESSGAATAIATPAKSRRPHRKSRNGCVECKHRHMRCDERRPSCANCEAAERICSFLTPQASNQNKKQWQPYRRKLPQQPEATAVVSPGFEASNHSKALTAVSADEEHADLSPPVLQLQHNHQELDQTSDQLSCRSVPNNGFLPPITSFEPDPHHTPSPSSPIPLTTVHTPPDDCCPGLSAVSDIVSEAIFTSQHMILMHHADKVPNSSGPNRNIVDIAVRHAIGSPYLLDEVLAFTAFHLASLYPGSAVHLRRLATELQNRALASFTQLTKTVPSNDKATAVPRFLFSAILGRHVLADTLTYCSSDFHFFIDRFVEGINLNRGIRTVTPPAWDYLHNSEMMPFFRIVRDASDKIITPGNECDPLNRIMDDSDLNEASVKACRQAIETLQWSFDLCHHLDEEDYPQSASAFSVRLVGGFVDVLRKHRPEALLILTYYGVLLYRCRGFRGFGDAGASLIRNIAGRLSSYWQEALAWPLHVLETERNSETLS